MVHSKTSNFLPSLNAKPHTPSVTNPAPKGADTESQVQLLSLGEIDFAENSPKNPDIDAVCDSIRGRGLDNPLIVRRLSTEKRKQYEIVDGTARHISAYVLGINTVPAIVVQMSDAEANRFRSDHYDEKRLRRLFGVSLGKSTETLCFIAGMMERSRALNIEIGELDRLADGMAMKNEDDLVDRGHWFDDILKTLNWWWRVSDTLLGSTEGSEGSDGCFVPDPAFAHHREALSALLNDTLAAFVPAWQENYHFSTDWMDKGEATRELLKKYRTFTRYVCTLAQEVWPDVNMAPLLSRA